VCVCVCVCVCLMCIANKLTYVLVQIRLNGEVDAKFSVSTEERVDSGGK